MNIDWEFVGKVARASAGDVPGEITPPGLQDRADRAAEQIIEVTAMEPLEPLPPVEWVSRGAWVDANLVTMRSLIEPVIERAGIPKGASPLAGTLTTAAIALEIGALMAMLSRRVLGQLEINLLDAEQQPRLLMVAPNLENAVTRMNVPREDFITWVLLHEVTHSVQFTSVPWLRRELGGTLTELLSLAEIHPDPKALLKLRPRDFGRILGSVREGGLIGAVAGPEKRELLGRMQGTMGLVEGHAEWAMDEAGESAVPRVDELRTAMTRRRGERAPVLKLLDRLLGFDLKMRQYEHGKAFCDAVVAARGREGLADAWSSSERAPSVAELSDPPLWLGRPASAG